MQIVVLLVALVLSLGACSSPGSVYEDASASIAEAKSRAAAGDRAGMDEALTEATKIAQGGDGWYYDDALREAIDIRLSAGDVDGAKADLAALEVWHVSHPAERTVLDPRARASVASVLLKAGRLDEAVQVAEKIGPDCRAVAHQLDVEDARALRSDPYALPWVPVTCNDMDVAAEVFTAAGRPKDAGDAWAMRLVNNAYGSAAGFRQDLDKARPIFATAYGEQGAEALDRDAGPLLAALTASPYPVQAGGNAKILQAWAGGIVSHLPADSPFASAYQAEFDFWARMEAHERRSPPQAAPAPGGRSVSRSAEVDPASCRKGPRCAEADARATPLISGYSVSGAAPAASAAYCANKVVAEVARICAVEMRDMGQTGCAELADRQAKASEEATMQNAGVAASVSSSSSWSAACGWK